MVGLVAGGEEHCLGRRSSRGTQADCHLRCEQVSSRTDVMEVGRAELHMQVAVTGCVDMGCSKKR